MKCHIHIFSPDDLPITPEPFPTLRAAVTGLGRFLSSYDKGYVTADRTIIKRSDLLDHMRIKLVPADPDAVTAAEIVRELVSAFPELDELHASLNGGDAVERISELRAKAATYIQSQAPY